MQNIEIFEEIFWAVGEAYGLTGWWEIYDSEIFEEVEARIAQTFEVEDASEVDGFLEWANEMAEDL